MNDIIHIKEIHIINVHESNIFFLNVLINYQLKSLNFLKNTKFEIN